MPTNFENTENHVAQSLKSQPDSTKAFSQELHNMQRCETPKAFQQDMGKLNDDLHKQGLLPGLQIVENEKTHDFELKKIDDAKDSGAPDNTTPTRGSTEREQPEQPARHGGGGGGGGGGGHHHGRHHGRHHHGKHHRHHGGRDGGDDKSTANGDDPHDNADKGAPGDRTDKTDGSKVASDGSNMSKNEKEKYIVGELTKSSKDGGLGLTQKQAAGVIGSLEGESPDLNTGRVDHKHEHDLGFVNWIGKRRKELEHFASAQGKDPTDFKTQVSFMEKELQGSEHKALDRLKRTTTEGSAAESFTNNYERPGIPHMRKRIHNAEIAYENVQKWQNSALQPGDVSSYEATA